MSLNVKVGTIDPNPLTANQTFTVTLPRARVEPDATLLDDFNRADQAPVTGWSTMAIDGNFNSAIRVISNNLGTNTDATGYWNTSFNADQFARAKITALPSGANSYGLFCRVQGQSASTWTGYELSVYPPSGGGNWRLISKPRAGGSVTLVNSAAGMPTISVGDEIALTCDGSTIRIWYKSVANGKWVVLYETVDATGPSDGGYIGVRIADSAQRFDDFRGGNRVATVETFDLKALRFFTMGRQASGAGRGDLLWSSGAATKRGGTLQTWYGMGGDDNAAGTSVTYRGMNNTNGTVLKTLGGTTPDVTVTMDLRVTNFAADTFTVTLGAVSGTNRPVFSWVAFGGSDITDAIADTATTPASASTVNHALPAGFGNPDMIMASSVPRTTLGDDASHGQASEGIALSPTQQYVATYNFQDAATTMNLYQVHRWGTLILPLLTGGSFTEGNLVAPTSTDNFRVAYPTVSAVTVFGYLAFKLSNNVHRALMVANSPKSATARLYSPRTPIGSRGEGITADWVADTRGAAFKFTAAETTSITRIGFHNKVANPNLTSFEMGIYADNGAGNPGLLLAKGSVENLDEAKSPGPMYATLASAVPITAGTVYHLAATGNGEQFDWQGTSAASSYSEGVTNGSLPSTWSGSGRFNNLAAIWGEDENSNVRLGLAIGTNMGSTTNVVSGAVASVATVNDFGFMVGVFDGISQSAQYASNQDANTASISSVGWESGSFVKHIDGQATPTNRDVAAGSVLGSRVRANFTTVDATISRQFAVLVLGEPSPVVGGDTTPPVFDIINIEDTDFDNPLYRMSRVAGRDLITVEFDVGAEAITAWKAKIVPSTGSTHDQGVTLETGGAVAAFAGWSFDITDDEIVAAEGGVVNGDKIIKIFVQDAAGNWST